MIIYEYAEYQRFAFFSYQVTAQCNAAVKRARFRMYELPLVVIAQRAFAPGRENSPQPFFWHLFPHAGKHAHKIPGSEQVISR